MIKGSSAKSPLAALLILAVTGVLIAVIAWVLLFQSLVGSLMGDYQPEQLAHTIEVVSDEPLGDVSARATLPVVSTTNIRERLDRFPDTIEDLDETARLAAMAQLINDIKKSQQLLPAQQLLLETRLLSQIYADDYEQLQQAVAEHRAQYSDEPPDNSRNLKYAENYQTSARQIVADIRNSQNYANDQERALAMKQALQDLREQMSEQVVR